MSDMSSRYESVILARIGEIALKGLNRSKFESKLIGNIKRRVSAWGNFKVEQKQSRIWIIPRNDECDLNNALEEVVHVFGLVSASIAWKTDKSMSSIRDASIKYVDELLHENPGHVKFKVEARRADKSFELTSPEICEDIGALILTSFDKLAVDVRDPDFVLMVEVRDGSYIYSGRKQGLRGLPVGTAGKGMLLLSGGIDSPVAGYMMASRGMELEAVYFHSFPYTSDNARQKVIDLAGIVRKYSGRIRLHIVDFTAIQLELKDNCPADMLVIIMRRMMMRIASEIAVQAGALALITGESLGQVASQTAQAIICTDDTAKLPVYRPLIGMDKEDTIKTARKIGSYETSILPFEDCCTVFVAKHPKLEPDISMCLKAESSIDVESLISYGVDHTEIIDI
ncbi:MAG: tRNA 4-thiouridine(8) synthase ThiI [Eubacteriales bacterium]|nr:tRNA 4-thiouridine(8) synthase ThiI [Eubacteriales bacterium]MDD4717929.1 tRNA 4-thiouridine(8) synthase ThiI [Eubacteriales bacterium]